VADDQAMETMAREAQERTAAMAAKGKVEGTK
jgi:hypothetical protein